MLLSFNWIGYRLSVELHHCDTVAAETNENTKTLMVFWNKCCLNSFCAPHLLGDDIIIKMIIYHLITLCSNSWKLVIKGSNNPLGPWFENMCILAQKSNFVELLAGKWLSVRFSASTNFILKSLRICSSFSNCLNKKGFVCIFS